MYFVENKFLQINSTKNTAASFMHVGRKTAFMSIKFCQEIFQDKFLESTQHGSMCGSVYIVYLGAAPEDPAALTSQHQAFLTHAAKGSEGASTSHILYSYQHLLNGFAAKLSSEMASRLSDMPEVLSVFPAKSVRKHSTHTWQYLGVDDGTIPSHGHINTSSLWGKSVYGRNVIIGVIDTGIWPESASFADNLMHPPPKRWKGICETGIGFNSSNCNRKIIGARMYYKGLEEDYGRPLRLAAPGEYASPRDKDGHGTHVASIVAGSFVPGANLFGFAKGISKGGAPLAYMAIYKACWNVAGTDGYCSESDVLAAMDDAIKDGVDMISMSLGLDGATNFLDDALGIGSFHAMLKNIVISTVAGNAGPGPYTVVNPWPWTITAAASTIDRDFEADAIFGDGTTLKDIAINESNKDQASYCVLNTLDQAKTKGKVVYCSRGANARIEKGYEVLRAGGVGLILGNRPEDGEGIVSDSHVLPATAFGSINAIKTQIYANSTRNPVAKITPATTKLGNKQRPTIAFFSSRGPNPLNGDILKPDITAPGVDILGAWTRADSPTTLSIDKRRVDFDILSGTSSACPHVSAVVALLKVIYPKWSATALKSAIMTTARTLNDMKEPIIDGWTNMSADPFSMGAGMINPLAALYPGLVYDALPINYFLFLCALGYKNSILQKTIGANYTCPSQRPSINSLNSPSIAISTSKKEHVIFRTVTNVGGISTYNVKIQAPIGVLVVIEPSALHFQAQGETKTFKVTLTIKQPTGGDYVFGSYTWKDGIHSVKSPIVVLT
ncbi:hypothetical protein O6H91_Y233700 [Diphasiastrum complanatum]|nr:hypothetical protein O6H91_Y146900 [Diphasiastrum complanatum]KAJ7299426.1 hypothetical protein O6H91_Y233700 [Diphasiastrum complanatum]